MTEQEFIDKLKSCPTRWNRIFSLINSYEFTDTASNELINALFGKIAIFLTNYSSRWDGYTKIIKRSEFHHILKKITDKVKPCIDIQVIYPLNESKMYLQAYISKANRKKYYSYTSKGFMEISENEFNETIVQPEINGMLTVLTLTEMEKSDAILA